MSEYDVLQFVPAATRKTLTELAQKLNISTSALTAAVLAQDALKNLSSEDRRKALAVLVALEGSR